MSPAPHDEEVALSLLQRIDQVCSRFEDAWKARQRPALEAYLGDAPEPERMLLCQELLALEIAYRRRAGETPREEEYQARFPCQNLTWLLGCQAAADEAKVDSVAEISSQPGGDVPAAGFPADDLVISLRCPQCRTAIPFIDEHSDYVLCPGCGGSFRMRDARQTTSGDARSFGKFHLLERVGLGAFGAVWRAWDSTLAKIVALKIPHRGLLTQGEELERFHREARAAAQLRHPGIVTVHEVVTVDRLPAIAADFIDGVSLKDFLKLRRLTFREAASLIADVAETMDYAHQIGLVHRDLKPANIMIESAVRGPLSAAQGPGSAGVGHGPQSTDGGLKPLVLDFGLASRGEAEITMTQDGHILGTPAYMSPEQAAGRSHQADRRSDVYSLGVIFYELLCGELPFRGSKLMMLQQVRWEEPRPPRRLNDKIPRDLETICLKAMAKEPTRRYPSARELAEELRRFLSGQPIQARPVSAWERMMKWAKRRPAAAALLVVSSLAVLSLIGLTGAWWQDLEARAAAVHELGQAKSELKGLEQVAAAKRAEVESLAKSIEQEREQVQSAQVAKRRAFYIRDIQLADMALGKEQVGRMVKLLESYRPARKEADQEDVRAWEWHYLWRLCHRERFQGRHQDSVGFAVFASDGKRLVTVDVEGISKLWDVATGKELATPLSLKGRVPALSFTLDGKTLAVASEDGTVKLWDWDTGQLKDTIKEWHEEKILALAFAPDGKILAMGGSNKTVKLLDVVARQERAILHGHRGEVFVLKFSPGGSNLVTISTDQTAKLWDVATGKERRAFTGKAGVCIINTAFAPDGKILAMTEMHPYNRLLAGSVRLWDVATGKERSAFPVLGGGSFSVAFSPDGKTLASGGSFNGAIKLWDVATGRVRNTFYAFSGQAGRVYYLTFSPDGKMLASCSDDKTMRLWDLVARPSPATLQGGRVAFAPDGKTLASGSRDQGVKLWDPITGQEKGTFQEQGGLLTSVAFSPDSKTLVTGNEDTTVRLWDVAAQELAILRGHSKKVQSVAFSPDGKTLASGAFDGTVRLWDVATGKTRAILEHNFPQVWCVSFAPDGKTLASAGGPEVKLWDAATGQKRATVPMHGGGLISVSFSPDSRMLAAGDWWDWTVYLWEAATGKELARFTGHAGPVLPVVFTRDGKTVVSGSGDTTVKLWDVATGQERFTLKGHEAIITDLAFSPDGTMLATASDDKTVRLWDAAPDDGPERAFRVESSSVEQDRAWHRREAKEAETTRQWFTAVWHLNRLIDARHADWLLHIRRGRAYAGLGQQTKALADCMAALYLLGAQFSLK